MLSFKFVAEDGTTYIGTCLGIICKPGSNLDGSLTVTMPSVTIPGTAIGKWEFYIGGTLVTTSTVSKQ